MRHRVQGRTGKAILALLLFACGAEVETPNLLSGVWAAVTDQASSALPDSTPDPVMQRQLPFGAKPESAFWRPLECLRLRQGVFVPVSRVADPEDPACAQGR